MNERYDEQTGTLWIASALGPDDLVPNDEIQGWIDALKAGRTPDGRELHHLNYVFANEEAADYNYHALKFARIGACVGTLDDPRPVGDDAVDFDTKDDFGI